MGKLDTLVQQKIDADTDFQSSLADLSDKDREAKIAEKRSELLDSEYERLESESTKHKELADNYKIRAEKAERSKKDQPAGEEKPPKKDDSEYSLKDIRALNSVHEDDVDWVAKQAKASEKTIAEVLKDEEVQAVLKLRNEKRKSADVANVKPARPGGRRPDGSSLLKELVSEGKVPNDKEEAEELFWARRGGKPKR